MNTVEVQGKGIVPMDQLQIGDYVKAGNDRFSRVYSFSHLDKSAEATFLQIHTDQLDQPLEVSPDHIVYVSGGKAVRASDVRVGDRMYDGYNVSRITVVQRHGVYAPVTYSGDIMVSGVVASSYVSLLDHVSPGIQNRAAHLVTGIHRLICSLSFSICEQETYDTDGLSHFIKPIAHWMRNVNDQNALIQFLAVFVAVPLLLIVYCTEHFLLVLSNLFVILLSVLLSSRGISRMQTSTRKRFALTADSSILGFHPWA
jgi:hypothetical protein